MKHTKGKWEITKNAIALNSELSIINNDGIKPILICEMTNIRGDSYSDNSSYIDGNAKLIAAAPEMLEALIRAEKILGAIDGYVDEIIKKNIGVDSIESYVECRDLIKHVTE